MLSKVSSEISTSGNFFNTTSLKKSRALKASGFFLVLALTVGVLGCLFGTFYSIYPTIICGLCSLIFLSIALYKAKTSSSLLSLPQTPSLSPKTSLTSTSKNSYATSALDHQTLSGLEMFSSVPSSTIEPISPAIESDSLQETHPSLFSHKPSDKASNHISPQVSSPELNSPPSIISLSILVPLPLAIESETSSSSFTALESESLFPRVSDRHLRRLSIITRSLLAVPQSSPPPSTTSLQRAVILRKKHRQSKPVSSCSSYAQPIFPYLLQIHFMGIARISHIQSSSMIRCMNPKIPAQCPKENICLRLVVPLDPSVSQETALILPTPSSIRGTSIESQSQTSRPWRVLKSAQNYAGRAVRGILQSKKLEPLRIVGANSAEAVRSVSQREWRRAGLFAYVAVGHALNIFMTKLAPPEVSDLSKANQYALRET